MILINKFYNYKDSFEKLIKTFNISYLKIHQIHNVNNLKCIYYSMNNIDARNISRYLFCLKNLYIFTTKVYCI